MGFWTQQNLHFPENLLSLDSSWELGSTAIGDAGNDHSQEARERTAYTGLGGSQ